jgi:hypothetical protein
VRQRKFIKYNHLIANLLVFYNVVTMTKALQQLEAYGHAVSDEVLAALSPYQTEHINRFGTPESADLTMGFNSLGIRAEKSRYDLARI